MCICPLQNCPLQNGVRNKAPAFSVPCFFCTANDCFLATTEAIERRVSLFFAAVMLWCFGVVVVGGVVVVMVLSVVLFCLLGLVAACVGWCRMLSTSLWMCELTCSSGCAWCTGRQCSVYGFVRATRTGAAAWLPRGRHCTDSGRGQPTTSTDLSHSETTPLFPSDETSTCTPIIHVPAPTHARRNMTFIHKNNNARDVYRGGGLEVGGNVPRRAPTQRRSNRATRPDGA